MTNKEIRWPEARPAPRPRVPCTVCGGPLRDFDAADKCRSCEIASLASAPEPRYPEKRSKSESWAQAAFEIVGEFLGWPFWWP